jgi:hypothetical protein
VWVLLGVVDRRELQEAIFSEEREVMTGQWRCASSSVVVLLCVERSVDTRGDDNEFELI